MNRTFFKIGFGTLALAGVVWAASAAAPGTRQLHGHVPAAVSHLSSTGRVGATNNLHLAIGLSLRNQAGLNALLQQIYDPASTNYHHYLTSEDFAAQYAPTEQDYQALVNFARAQGFVVTAKHSNRMLLEVSAKARDVEHAFNVTLHNYRHPKDGRTFYAPDVEPTVPATLSVADISGLNNYARPHPKLRLNAKNTAAPVQPRAGSGPGGNYLGNDFRAAYVPGTTLTGAGQKIALVQFDGYVANDIALYAQQAGLASVPSLTNILLNGFSGIPTFTGGEVEVSLDIEMVISMAPGLSQVLVYEGDPYNFIPNVVLNRIATDNSARQVSCSWGWTGGPDATAEQIFQQMAVQGQSFYNASGDSDAFLPGEVDSPFGFGFPSCSPNITQVGGTTLTTAGPSGGYVSEQVWNWGLTYGVFYDGVGSSGGISDHYPTPAWQQGFGTSTNHGSATGRNIPDVAMTGDNVYVIASGGVSYPGTGGTSCAAPLWAGFTALVNQQAALNGRASVGFINPAIYALAKSAAYASAFNDITNGNNTWSQSPTNFPAVPGYDLCTGLGTPRGTNLINSLAGVSYGGPTISAPKTWDTSLSVMNGTDPNGPWFLFVQDTRAPYSGIISNGWFVSLTTANPVGYAADNQIYTTVTSTSLVTGANFSFTLAVTNYGPSVSTNVFVSDILPETGVALISSSLTQGLVNQIGSTLTWAIGNLPVNAGAALTLNFAANANGTYTNSAVVNATTADPNPDDDAVGTSITVGTPVPPHLTPTFIPGPGGSFQLSVTGDPNVTVIQGSTNLLVWIPLYTNTPPFTFTNLNSGGLPVQFYRALVGP